MSEISDDKFELLQIFHHLIRAFQKTRQGLWGQELDGATTIEVSILSIIEHNPNIILKEIVQMLGIPNSTLTAAIDRLEKRGLIARTISNRDRRSFRLELTMKGKAAQLEHRKGENILIERILASFSTVEEKKALNMVLEKITNNLEECAENEHLV
jgi:Transcriptional regulators